MFMYQSTINKNKNWSIYADCKQMVAEINIECRTNQKCLALQEHPQVPLHLDGTIPQAGTFWEARYCAQNTIWTLV